MIDWVFSSVDSDSVSVDSATVEVIQNTILEAAKVWARYLDVELDVAIEIDLTIASFGENDRLAEAGTFFFSTGNNEPGYTVGQATTINELNTGQDATPLGGVSLPSGGDLRFILNADIIDQLFFETDFDNRDSEIPEGLYDFFSIALHELGHGLGILSFRDHTDTLQSSFGSSYDANIVIDEQGNPIFAGEAVAELLNGEDLVLNSGTASHVGDSEGNALDQAIDRFALLSASLDVGQRGFVSALEIAILQDIDAPIRASTDADDTLFGFERTDLTEYFTNSEIADLPLNALSLASGDDEIRGGAGNDTLIGLSGDDLLEGGLGDDILEGGIGDDVFFYRAGDGSDIIRGENLTTGSNRIVFVSIERDDVSATISGDDIVILITGQGQNSSIVLEDLADTDFAAVIEGIGLDDGSSLTLEELLAIPSNVVEQPAPNNDGEFETVLFADSGEDSILLGSNTSETLHGSTNNEILNGLGGDDLLLGSVGADVLDGGDGLDTASYTSSNGAIFVNLSGDLNFGADAFGDYLINIENITGSNFSDFIQGSVVGNQLSGGGGNDNITGFGGDDEIFGGAGSDVIQGVSGANQLYGDAGEDSIFGGVDDDLVDGGEGNDLLFGASGNDELFGGAGVDVLNGGDGDDQLHGGTLTDFLIGGEGQDTLNGDDGDDVLFAGSGNDISFGGTGNDVLIGEAGADQLSGDEGNDFLSGGAGADELFGGGEGDVLDGGADDDYLDGGTGRDTLVGGLGADEVNGGDGIDLIYGDLIAGTGLDVTGGDDVLNGGLGGDLIFAGGGNDTIDGGEDSDVLFAGTGNDVLSGGNGNDVLIADSGDDHVDGGLGDDMAFGGEGNDILTDLDGNNLLNGGLGDDNITGGAGQDFLIGEGGRDVIEGGDGNDIVFGDNVNDGAVGGDDTLNGGSGGDQIYAGGGNDTISGDAGVDVLYGEAGDDQISGGLGNDFLIGGAGSDVFIFDKGDGFDTIVDYQAGIDQLDFTNFEFESTADVLAASFEQNGNVYFDFADDGYVAVLDATASELSNDILI